MSKTVICSATRQKPFDLLYWNSDQTNLPGPLHVTSLRRLYLENALAKGDFEVEGKKIDLQRASRSPVFIHAARKDHISPFPSVYKGVKLFGGDVTFVLADSGHIAGVVNPPAANKYRYWISDILPPTSDGWMAYAKEHPGSWWPLWADWLKERSGAGHRPALTRKGCNASAWRLRPRDPRLHPRQTRRLSPSKPAGTPPYSSIAA